jgi:hypothetical protein
MLPTIVAHPSSFRDPSGFIFEKDGAIYRQVNLVFRENFDLFISSGCYTHLVKNGLLIPHEKIDQNLTGDPSWYTTLKPERIQFISYPYEWSFDMLKDAALLTLRLMKETLPFGIVLKDATPYNIQWYEGKFVFIDTLSFEKYEETPWIAYRQFCENFLGPLLIIHYAKTPLHQLQMAWPDGIPLDIIKSLLPGRSKFSFHTYLHIHLHQKVVTRQRHGRYANTEKFSRQKLVNLISSLELLVNKLRLNANQSTWSEYYDEASLRNNYLQEKKDIINRWLKRLGTIKTAADLGCNKGEFSRLLATKGIYTIATDYDPYCINELYQSIKIGSEKNIQPLIVDLANPTPSLGFNNTERSSFYNRLDAELVLALALIHHLTIGKNIPLDKIASVFHQASRHLIIEFVPKEDAKIKMMLQHKKDIYPDYSEENFVASFSKFFSIEEKQAIPGSVRTLYLLKKIKS